ncbi:Transposase zinc-binding domain protein [anaerobic digester metagenome]
MLEVQDVFLAHSDEYRQKHKLSIVQHKAVNAILNCRTARLGGHVDTCPSCGEPKFHTTLAATVTVLSARHLVKNAGLMQGKQIY